MIEVLSYLLESYWRTFAVIVAIALFRPVRIKTIRKENNDE